MTSSERPALTQIAPGGGFEPAPWAANALLHTQAQAPRFARTVWDEQAATPFGPWRVAPPVDPLDIAPGAPAAQADAAAEPMDAPHNPPPGEPPADAATEGPDGPGVSPAALDFHTQAALQAAQDAAYERGLQAGLAQARAEVEAERGRERELLRHLGIELRALSDDPQRFFEPLRRLALHLAEQLVRAELKLSGEAISQLVRQALAQLEQPTDKAVVSLHPADLAQLQAMGPDVLPGLQLEADPHLSLASVRVRVQDTVVQDLIEHRLEALARPLVDEPQAWMQRSSLLHPRPGRSAAADVEDVQARPASAGEEDAP